ncbi:MAG: hypothetical protein JF607_07305 [Burkholderiales bacterium]|nr:hypothetical protein [Burkholderiales bacterium]MBW8892988.1 hypothetical protein [Burkholderiales bacterium]
MLTCPVSCCARPATTHASERSHRLEWMRMPGDVVFIAFGAVPLVIASVKPYLGVRGRQVDTPKARPGEAAGVVPVLAIALALLAVAAGAAVALGTGARRWRATTDGCALGWELGESRLNPLATTPGSLKGGPSQCSPASVTF